MLQFQLILEKRPPDVDTMLDILRSLGLARSLFKGRNAPIWRKREPTHMRLPVTDGLRLGRGVKLKFNFKPSCPKEYDLAVPYKIIQWYYVGFGVI